MKIRLLGTEIYISFLFAAVITVMLATDRTGLCLPSLFAVIMHEIGHLFAMWVLDCSPKGVRLIPASVQITSSFSRGYRNDIIIAVCGPLVNFILFLTLYFNYLAFKNQLTLYYGLLNLVIGLFNSLPVLGLDGGTVLFSVLAKKTNLNRAALTVRIITLICAAAVIISAVTLTVRGKINISLYIIGIYLLIMSIMKI
ncbi:MAG: hypothetical protein IKD04_10160 [Clostridia bacterium]|nr:hypothetical protein [Clostridia bacterium]